MTTPHQQPQKQPPRPRPVPAELRDFDDLAQSDPETVLIITQIMRLQRFLEMDSFDSAMQHINQIHGRYAGEFDSAGIILSILDDMDNGTVKNIYLPPESGTG